MIYHSKIIGKRIVARDTLEVSFERPPKFSFKAGQYIQLGVPNLLYSDPKGKSRTMSIASSPTDQEKISIAFRETGSGFKRTLKELPQGALVNIEGPHGFFTMPEKSIDPVILIAGGIGITPYLSMLRFANEKHLAVPITLLYTNRSKESAAYLRDLQNIANHNTHLTLKDKVGKIDEQFIQQSVKDMQNCKWYIAGPPAMVDNTRNILALLGIDEARISYEGFTGY